MSDQHIILCHWKNELKIFDDNLLLLKKRPNSIVVHDIRVAIKKLKAYFKLYNFLKKEVPGKDLMIKTQEMFDILGIQRDIETCLELLSLYEKEHDHSYEILKQHLKIQLRKAKDWTNQSIHSFNNKELLKILSMLKKDEILENEKTHIQSIEDIVIDYFLKIRDHFKKPHKIRQSIKTVYYWVLILPAGKSSQIPGASKLHDIGNELGKWQDNELLLTRTRHYRKDYLPGPFEETKSIKILEEKIKDKKGTFRKSALSKVKRLVSESELSELKI